MSLGYENSRGKSGADDAAVVYGEPGKRNYSLTLELPDGIIHSLNNSYWHEATYDPTEGRVLIIFSSKAIVIEGKRLEKLVDGLSGIAVDRIRVSSSKRGDDESNVDEPWIDSIKFND